MTESTLNVVLFPVPIPENLLDALLCEGALKLLTQAMESEVEARFRARKHLVDEHGHQAVVRNGLSARSLGSTSMETLNSATLVKEVAEIIVFVMKLRRPPDHGPCTTFDKTSTLPVNYLKGVS